MARYMEIAKQANERIIATLQCVKEIAGGDLKDADVIALSTHLAHVYNLGVRTNPRACQSTVRFNAVRAAMNGLPVSVVMETVTDERTGKDFNALKVKPKV